MLEQRNNILSTNGNRSIERLCLKSYAATYGMLTADRDIGFFHRLLYDTLTQT